jgi:alpha/beta superfamily hydrolase
MFDYRGYGMSEGNPTEEGMYKDVRAVYQWLLDNGSNSNQIIVYGFSLGSAPATDLAAFGHNGDYPSKLILESPFASADFIAQESTLIEVSASYITSLEFDNANKIKQVYSPFMLIIQEMIQPIFVLKEHYMESMAYLKQWVMITILILLKNL